METKHAMSAAWKKKGEETNDAGRGSESLTISQLEEGSGKQRRFSIFVLHPYRAGSYPLFICLSVLGGCEGKSPKREPRKTRRGDEEMKRRGGGQKIERSANRLCWNKACWGHQRRRGVVGVGGDEQRGGHKQTINTVSPKGKTGKWGCDKSSDTLPSLPGYHAASHALTAATTHTHTHTYTYVHVRNTHAPYVCS